MVTLSNNQAEWEGEPLEDRKEDLLPEKESPFRPLALVLIEQAISELKRKRERELRSPAKPKRRSRAEP